VLVAVATRFPDASVTFPSVNPIRDPALTTAPTAVSGPLAAVTALRWIERIDAASSGRARGA
jgi:hypothetical protein